MPFSVICASRIEPKRHRHYYYWIHIGAILAFLIYIPGSKHRHMFLAVPNIYFRNLEPAGTAPAVPSERETPGVASLAQFDWKQQLDLLSCTECGRCQAVCPAYASGLPLSPKMLITDMRDALANDASTPLVGGMIAEETLWACTTCRACMEACPVEIEHLPKIIDMRRHLVDEGQVSPILQEALTNLTRLGNSMGKPSKMRARWTKELGFPVKDARSEPVDVLWFVGDYASYDPRVQDLTRKVAELITAAGVDFGILFDAERNSGNDVRRAGEEGLFETLAQSNIDAIRACSFNRIVTTDPHSLNALKNDCRHFGGAFEGASLHGAACRTGRGGQACYRPDRRHHSDLSQSLLSRPLQWRIRRAARPHQGSRLYTARHAALPGEFLLLRRRRRPHLAER
ncbi:MAG: (Fe-S)-binding protein [Mesorhizobium sp.]|nr:MAG: (Fe-S)-binding protein [Mesorhizobium sp.]